MEYNFKALNYLGSKFRLLDFIEEKILSITSKGEGICDLFAGSGCVSYRLSQNFPIISCDIQSYSTTICNALLKKNNVSKTNINNFISILQKETKLFTSFYPLIKIEEEAIFSKQVETLTEIIEKGSLEVNTLENKESSLSPSMKDVLERLKENDYFNEKSLISRYYGGVYFSYRQSVWIDVILECIYKYIPEINRSIFLAALLSTASDIANTVGKHFAQPLKARDSKGKIKTSVYTKALKNKTIDIISLYHKWLLKYFDLPKTSFDCNVLRGDYLECLKHLPDNIKTIYADPPYTRDHYSRFYHVLETIILRDSPELSKTTIRGSSHISNGLYRNDRFQSPFCIKSQAPEAFHKMFESTSKNKKNLILSYSPYKESSDSHPRVVTLKQLSTTAKEFYPHVSIISAGNFKHSKLNSSEHLLNASNEAEVLIICTN